MGRRLCLCRHTTLLRHKYTCTVEVPSPCSWLTMLTGLPKILPGNKRQQEKLKPHLSAGYSLVLQTWQSGLLLLFCSTCTITFSGWEPFRNGFSAKAQQHSSFCPAKQRLSKSSLPSLEDGCTTQRTTGRSLPPLERELLELRVWPTDNHRLTTKPQEYWETNFFFLLKPLHSAVFQSVHMANQHEGLAVRAKGLPASQKQTDIQ